MIGLWFVLIKEMTMITEREDRITKAVDNLIDSWDIDTLIDFAYKERLYYFMDKASDEEVDELIDNFGDDNDN
jgi:dissimilatory sulfite reductase (desulfoviridin) alpha/beta subunit